MGHIGRINFVLLFGMIIFIPLMLNYYVIKILITLLSFSFISWKYSLTELLLVTICCGSLGILFGFYVQSKRMVVASMEQNSIGNSFVKITIQNKRLLRNTDKIEVVWDKGLESIQTLHKRLKLQIPKDGESLHIRKGSVTVNFLDEDGNLLYKTKTD